MKKVLINKLKKKAEELYSEQRHEEIIELLIPYDVREDQELALMLVRAFLDVSENKDDDILDSAEMLLMLIPNAEGDPRWTYQLARAYYFKERYCEAYRELLNVRKLAAEGKDFPEQNEANELFELVKAEYDKVCAVSYSKKEYDALTDHIVRHFGAIVNMCSQKEYPAFKVEVAEIPPADGRGRDYYTYVTIGIGAHIMKVPFSFGDMVPERCELVMYLPADIDDEMRRWAVSYLCTIGRLPIERNTWSSYGHIFSNGRPIFKGTKLFASTLIEIQDADEEASVCTLPNEESVTFYQVFPLYKEEVDFKFAHGLAALIEKMPHISAVIDPERENVCLNEERKPDEKPRKGSPLLVEETDYVSKLGIGELCCASKRITEEGCLVGYMRRNLIDKEIGGELSGDSGWLFMSGFETAEYLSDPNNMEICRLNIICNIDSEIVPFLKEPYNTVAVRGNDGKLHIEPNDPTDALLS
ncbi:MAG: DUF2185 domain-containing protein [Ruminococcus sp.]|nr:DUF2185 domain-containing protein [Ruminococcus sp.]